MLYLYGAKLPNATSATTMCMCECLRMCVCEYMQFACENHLALVTVKITKYQLTNAIMIDCYSNTIQINQYGME